MAEKNTSNIGFEKQIWDAACVLRGNIDASEYKSVVLGLIFLKYISDRFEAKYRELVDEGEGFEEDKDEYTAENIFFVPENARWSTIAASAHTPEIGTVIDDAMRSIEKENKRLKDILPKNFARPELDKRRLGEVVDLFTNIQMIEHGSSKDILGRTYEYCLSKFAEQEGVDIRLYSVIYAAIEEVKAAMEGMLAPEVKEVVTATIEVREVFHITKVGTVAGAVVKEGKVKRSDKARLIRDGIVIFSGSINALKRFKDDVKEVGTNFECGISLVNYNDLKVGDMIETYEEVEVKQTL